MTTADLRKTFANKTTIELIVIAENLSDDYTPEAHQVAKSLLAERCGSSIQIQEIWQSEIKRLTDLCEKCNVCHRPDKISYSMPFYFCKSTPLSVKLDWTSSAASLITLPILGLGRLATKHEYQVVELTLNLCNDCQQERTKRFFGVCLNESDYYRHPLRELYDAFRVHRIEVRW